MINTEKTGEILKTNRTKFGYSVFELSKKIDVSVQAIYQWERGLKIPRIDTFLMLSHLYNCSMEDLIGED